MLRDRDVRNQIVHRVANGEDSEAQDGIRDVEDDTKCLEQRDDLVCYGGEPEGTGYETGGANERVPSWTASGRASQEYQDGRDGAAEDAVEAQVSPASKSVGCGNAEPDVYKEKLGRCEYL